MFSSTRSLVAIGLLTVPVIQAATHQMIIGTFSTSFLYTVEFDDVADTLTLLKNTTAHTASQWLSLSHDKKTLYGNTASGAMEVVSYTLADDSNGTSIVYNTTTPAGACDTTAVHVEALPVSPYSVYAVSYGDDCGGVLSVVVNDDAASGGGGGGGGIVGGIASTQNYTYDASSDALLTSANGSSSSSTTSNATSSLHGLAFHPSGAYLYTADMGTQAVWTHAINASTGAVTPIARAAYPGGGQPRHVAVHPAGTHAYAMTEDSSEVVLFTLDAATGAAAYAGQAWGIVPANASGTHRGETVRLGGGGGGGGGAAGVGVLYASTRANASDPASVGGYVAGFTLAADGAVVGMDFVEATTTGGGGSTGASNMVVPALADENVFAVLDHERGFVEVWRRQEDGKGAGVVARLELGDGGGCCSNGVWLS